MKKGIIGGTFDPFHNGHMHIAYEALEKLELDKIVFIPTGNPPHKKNNEITEANIRYKVVEKAIKYESFFEINNYEILKEGYSFTYETLEYLSEKEPDTQWYFICGVDCLMEIEGWKNVSVILELCKLAVFIRPGYKEEQICNQKNKIEKIYNKNIILINLPQMDISSSYIRKRIENGKNISYLVPYSVNEDIKKLKLYTK
ncbi:nicotinate-nucleotide adenylyltransferase [Clostridium akagii]|uniref:nicotinate-nucleotide adenylyltransferase n=1 Tax=Clostridium akagii TaxID=91623 RepID=UPI00047CCA47|nr:nicotinate-nucleotide adenylyltransferase [Clostridium akagii]